MAKEIDVKIGTLKNLVEDYPAIYNSIESYNQSIQKVLNGIGDNSYAGVKNVLSNVVKSNGTYITVIKKMESTLVLAIQQYENTENEILGRKIENQKETERTFGGQGRKIESSNYFLDAIEQAILGDFSDKSNALGTAISVAFGFVPILGQVCDIRDLAADIIHLVDDGPTTEEWVALGFTAVGFIPGIGDFCKQGDEVASLLKHTDEITDGLSETIGAVMKKGDDVYSAAGKYVDDFNKYIDEKIMSKTGINDVIKNVDDSIKNMVEKIPHIDKIKEIGDKWEKMTVSDVAEELIKGEAEYVGEKYLGIDIEGWIADGIDWLIGSGEKDTGGTKVSNYECVA